MRLRRCPPPPGLRRSPSGAVVGFVIILVAAACTSDQLPPTTASAPTTSTTSIPVTVLPDESTTTVPADLPPCLAGDAPFVEDGSAGVLRSAGGDVTAVGGVTWHDYGGCEQIVIGYQTAEGAPAVDPPTVATLLIRDSGVLRLNLDATVSGSRFQEQRVDTPMVDAVFAVSTPSGSIFLDIHLADAVVTRVANVSGPGRTVVDVRRGGAPTTASPVRSGDLIVVEPLLGDVAYPFSISGYALVAGEEIDATLTGISGSVEATARVSGRYDTWGAFTILFTDGPEGPITVDVSGLNLLLTARR
jgi:hypothetical protein